MKYKNKLKTLAARVAAWDKLSNTDKVANKKPGSQKK